MIEEFTEGQEVEAWCARTGGAAARTTIGKRIFCLFDVDGVMVGKGFGKSWNAAAASALREAKKRGLP